MMSNELDDWIEIAEYIRVKYFACDDPTSDRYKMLMRRLTDEEFKLYDIGVVIDGHLRVIGFGDRIYVNQKTGEEVRSNYIKM